MNQQAFFIIQILADIALLAAIVFFIYRIREDGRRRSAGIDPSMLEEFKKLLAESQQGSANLVEAMDEGKKALRKIARVLDEKESRLRKIIEQPEAKPRKAARAGLRGRPPSKRVSPKRSGWPRAAQAPRRFRSSSVCPKGRSASSSICIRGAEKPSGPDRVSNRCDRRFYPGSGASTPVRGHVPVRYRNGFHPPPADFTPPFGRPHPNPAGRRDAASCHTGAGPGGPCSGKTGR